MAMQKSKENNFINRLMTVLFIFSILAAVKLIFVDYTMDEEYQIVMAYRNLSGDSIFGTMWEPHQTSAFMCIAIMYVFRLLTGGYAGVVITLRIVTELIRAALSYWIFGMLISAPRTRSPISAVPQKLNTIMAADSESRFHPKTLVVPK